ncbi:dUTP diphosphatase [Psychrobacillus sp. NPDC093200]|uniref:dUTP diphosphatase n=1 Tax=Psychrobacillus sp. NPDC093200 TaxID=3390656 RepID=UPI003CFE891B
MNLAKLFDTQKVLDARIMENHPELVGQNNLDWKILALQVELGECANEWRGFKKWSKDQEPRVEEDIPCSLCDGTGDLNYEWIQEDAEGTGNHEFIECIDCDCTGVIGVRNPLLEEYVDCLHFILSIGLELEFTDLCINHSSVKRLPEQIDSMINFSTVFSFVDQLRRSKSFHWYDSLFERFVVLGFSLGFTWEQIEQAYFEKNEINHNRQANGY